MTRNVDGHPVQFDGHVNLNTGDQRGGLGLHAHHFAPEGYLRKEEKLSILDGRCKYCDVTGVRSKRGLWGFACIGCKGTLTRWHRSRKYTKDQLLAARYDWETHEWRVPHAVTSTPPPTGVTRNETLHSRAVSDAYISDRWDQHEYSR